jgi:hypothetical protein
MRTILEDVVRHPLSKRSAAPGHALQQMMIRVGAAMCAALVSTATVGAQLAPQSIFTLDGADLVFTPARAAREVRAPLFPTAADALVTHSDDAGAPQQPFDWKAERRACEGCPRRSVGKALLQTTFINVIYEAANLIRGQVTARITPKTWWDNMSNGWVWDLDDFGVNQVGHPYQGNNYFTSGRANGLSFYESAALTAFGSGTWEYFGETNCRR